MENRNRNKLRIYYAAAFFLLLAAETCIALYVHDGFVRPYMGDMLVVIVVYCFVRILEPVKGRLLPIWVFLFAAAVEVSQYFRLDQALGLENFAPARIILGSTFDWNDMACYAAGAVLAGLWEAFFYKKNRSRRKTAVQGSAENRRNREQ